MRTILFVCTANVCRSPMAEAIFNALAEDRKLRWRAESAGVAALKGEPIASNANAAMEEIGVYAGGHRARQVSEELIEEADLILTMSPWHVDELRRVFGEPLREAYTLSNYVGYPGEEEITDPYGSTMNAFRASVRQLLGYVDLLVCRLEKGGRLPR